MTMIITCLTQNFVIQSSDRRISTVIDNKVQSCDDYSNKALVYKSQFVFAYTGQAKIPVRKNGRAFEISTIDWAAEQLTYGKSLDEAVENLKFRATELMNTNYVRKQPGYKRRIAFVGAGFEEFETGGKQIRKPLRIMVENFINDDGSILDAPRDDFRVCRHRLNSDKVALYVAGTPLAKEKTKFLRRFAEHNANPEQIGVEVTRKILETANSMPADRRTVGKNIMCNCVPLAYIDREDDGGMLVPSTGGILVEISANDNGSLIFKPVEYASLEDRIRFLPSFYLPNSPFDSPRFAYIAEDNKQDPYHSPIYVRPGKIVPTMISSDLSLSFTPNVSNS